MQSKLPSDSSPKRFLVELRLLGFLNLQSLWGCGIEVKETLNIPDQRSLGGRIHCVELIGYINIKVCAVEVNIAIPHW